MNNHEMIFVARDIRFSFLYILSANIVALFDRKSFYNRFCTDNGIEGKNAAKKYLPQKYLVEHSRIERFGKSRDRIIARAYLDFYNKSLNTNYAIAGAEKDIASQKALIKEYEDQLLETKKRAMQEKDAAEAIHLQSVVSNLATSIKNQKNILTQKEDYYADLLGIRINNEENWIAQLKQIEDEVDACIMNFIRKLGRRVVRKMSFSNFYYITPTYSDKVKDIKENGIRNATGSNKK